MIDARKSPELQAALLAVKRAGPELRKDIYSDARAELGAAWLPALQQRAQTSLERRVLLKGARVRVGTDGFRVMAATSNKLLSGGLMPSVDWPGAEFGARTFKGSYQRRSPGGKIHQVQRTLNRQFRGRSRDGRIAFDAASEIGTKLVASFVTTIVRVIRRAAQAEE